MNKDRARLASAADAGEDVLFPPIEARACGHLAVSRPHRLYWEESGNPNGVPVVFLHGGPGGGCGPAFRRFFDPSFWRIILFDQRGAGRSTPFADVTDNTTQHLIDDIEALRAYLEVDRWAVFGGSWGSTLALAYAQVHPQRVVGMVLRGIFLCTDPEIDWFLHGMGPQFFPEAYRAFTGFLPAEERGDLLGSYYARLTDPDPAVHGPAARSWSGFEEACSRLIPSRAPMQPPPAGAASPRSAERAGRITEPTLALARLEAHYMVNRGFMDAGQLMDNMHRLGDIPVTIVQGRYDMVCPIGTADAVAQTLKRPRYVIVPDAGHSALEPGTRRALLEAMQDLKGSLAR
ncbi:Proline iminopeptidase [Caenispirillum salinarum AK4]|uniref:Proline iminopeptidase n=1 Tax=Caenispirillum salinarum AK4 TaxID=1238182 RepID=K9HNV4_9PROT|nr:prolyl aminopeptidase [Caenispirillum salinarum]EKV32003.1 Proline iminopeptidase [Caenispirillum salinarum AK4]